MNYYNEFDPFAAAWLRELIKANLIPNGDVDERSITEVRASDLNGYTQCHFFAGIGGWSLALQLAGWPTDRPVWTGSCPCQPFSSAGKQKGKSDERHLWPVWLNLIQECRPPTVFGEQVSSAIAHGWLDDVYQGLEAEGYAVGSAVLPACSVGAPHKRDRLWFVADSRRTAAARRGRASASGSEGLYERGTKKTLWSTEADRTWNRDESNSNVAGTLSTGQQGHRQPREQSVQEGREGEERYPWACGVWIDCPDGKQRLVKSSIPLLAHGVSNRVGKLRGYGNAIVPQVAAKFIEAYLMGK